MLIEDSGCRQRDSRKGTKSKPCFCDAGALLSCTKDVCDIGNVVWVTYSLRLCKEADTLCEYEVRRGVLGVDSLAGTVHEVKFGAVVHNGRNDGVCPEVVDGNSDFF